MAMDMFLKIGALKGEAQDDKHKEEIDVLAWSWGFAQSGSAHIGAGGGSGKVNVVLTVRKAGENPLEYLIITMEDVLISSITPGGSGGEDRLAENVTLNFARVKVDYTEQNAKGGAGATPKMGWDIAKNVKI